MFAVTLSASMCQLDCHPVSARLSPGVGLVCHSSFAHLSTGVRPSIAAGPAAACLLLIARLHAGSVNYHSSWSRERRRHRCQMLIGAYNLLQMNTEYPGCFEGIKCAELITRLFIKIAHIIYQ